MNCKYCNSIITKEQNNYYNRCCDDICANRYEKSHSQHCNLCGLKITEEEDEYYGGFCSSGCAGEYNELRRERES